MADYYMDIAGSTTGPFDESGLRNLARNGGLLPETLVCREGADAWIAARELPFILDEDWGADAMANYSTTVSQAALRAAENSPAVTAPAATGAGWKHSSAANGCAGIGLAIMGLIFVIAIFGALSGNNGGGGAAMNSNSQYSDAHYTAEQFVMRQIPGAKKVSSLRESVFDVAGNKYMVGMNVDGLNAFGGPVRQALIVEMQLDGGTWRLIKIHSR